MITASEKRSCLGNEKAESSSIYVSRNEIIFMEV